MENDLYPNDQWKITLCQMTMIKIDTKWLLLTYNFKLWVIFILQHTVQHLQVQDCRLRNIKKYDDYDYSLTGVDRRVNLTLQEYYDVYDGKWSVLGCR